jgi:hypothetical protein
VKVCRSDQKDEKDQILMAIYVDQIFEADPMDYAARNPLARQAARHGTRWCHLWASAPEELERLHAIARAIGLKRQWFQDRPGFPHYDLVPSKRVLALKKGAEPKDLRDFLVETKYPGLKQGLSEQGVLI